MGILGKELKTLARHSSIYGFANIASQLIGFVMLPVYTHYLKPADYGIYQLAGLTVQVLGIILGLGIAGAIYRFYYEVDDQSYRNSVISTSCLGVPVLSFIGLGILSLNSRYIASLVLEGSGQWIYISMSLGTLWFNQQINMVYTYMRVTESSGKYVILSLSKLFSAVSLNIIFIVIMGWGVFGLFLSNLIVPAIFFIISYPFLLKKVGFNFSFLIAKKMLRFGLPMIPSNLAVLAVNASDRFFIKAFFTIADVGVYGLGYKLGSIVFYLVRVPFMQIWEPRRYALYRGGAPAYVYAKIATYFTGTMIFSGLAISIFAQDVIKIITPQEFWSAASYIPAVVVCFVIYAFDNHVAFGILVKKKTEYYTYVNLVMGVLNLALNFVLIPRYGIWGAIGATFFSLVFKITALHFISRRFVKIPFEWLRMSGIFLVAVGIYYCSVYCHPSVMWLALPLDALFVLLFIPIIWVIGLITPEERKAVKRILSEQLLTKGKSWSSSLSAKFS